MKALHPLRGIITILNTPYTPGGEVDFPAVNCNVKEALRAGVSGFAINIKETRTSKLSLFDKLKITETALDACNNEVPVFVGIGETADEAVNDLNIYKALGVKDVVVQIPYENDEQFKAEFHKVAEHVPGTIMLDIQEPQKNLSQKLLLDISGNVPSFQYLKINSLSDLDNFSDLQNLSDSKLNMVCTDISRMAERQKQGIPVFMPFAMHWVFTEIFNLFFNGNESEAVSLFNEIHPVIEFTEKHPDTLYLFFNRLLWKQGIFSSPLVKDMAPFNETMAQKADKLIKKIMVLEKMIREGRKYF
ncbi:MAG: hypothetical protein GXO47_10045 [Chlorobi bacterium]|nr:hypothetical protein [Chlorobiota bacterium]